MDQVKCELLNNVAGSSEPKQDTDKDALPDLELELELCPLLISQMYNQRSVTSNIFKSFIWLRFWYISLTINLLITALSFIHSSICILITMT